MIFSVNLEIFLAVLLVAALAALVVAALLLLMSSMGLLVLNVDSSSNKTDVALYLDAWRPPFREGWRRVEAVGAGLLWATLIAHFQHNDRLFVVALLIWRVAPLIFRVVVSAMPVGFAFGVFAYTVWADQIPRFGALDLTFNPLFSFLNGDVVLDILHIVASPSSRLGMLGGLYMVIFFVLFTYVVLNVCLVCVEFALEQFGAYLAAVAIQKELDDSTSSSSLSYPHRRDV